MDKIFYVYEHWRPDLDVCFYVGKGYGKRANNMQRNAHHKNIVNKLSSNGFCVEVRLVRSGLSEQEAFELEISRIAFWKNLGVRLANKSDGGEGPSGMIWSEEALAKLRIKRADRIFSEADRRAMSEGRIGMKFSDSHKANLAAKKIGRKRPAFTDETRAKMKEASLKREEAKRLKFGSEVKRNSKLREDA